MFGKRKLTWEMILSSYVNAPRDVKTNPLNGNGIWFYVYVENGDVFIENARNHPNSSAVKGRRKLDKENFEQMLMYYYKRENGEKVSQQANKITYNQVYWYGIFADV